MLGIGRVEFLGYHDSGMAGDAANAAPGAFCGAVLDEAAGRLAAILAASGATAVVGYDDDGIYGHPDHVQVTRLARAAAATAGVPTVYGATVDREYLHFVETHVVAEAGARRRPRPRPLADRRGHRRGRRRGRRAHGPGGEASGDRRPRQPDPRVVERAAAARPSLRRRLRLGVVRALGPAGPARTTGGGTAVTCSRCPSHGVHGDARVRSPAPPGASRGQHRLARAPLPPLRHRVRRGDRRRGPASAPADRLPGGAEAVLQAGRGSRAGRSARCGGRSRRTRTSAARIAVGALPELVDPIGIEWLRREEGWEGRIGRARGGRRRRRGAVDATTPPLRRAERRREAAEQAADPHPRRAGAAATCGSRSSAGRSSSERRAAGGVDRRARATLRAQLAEARAGRPPRQRPGRGGAQVGWRASRPSATTASRRAAAAEAQRDALLADRAERGGVGRVRRPGQRAARAGAVGAGARRPPRRAASTSDRPAGSPLALPGGVARDSRRATEHLLRAARRARARRRVQRRQAGLARRRPGRPAQRAASTSSTTSPAASAPT